MRKYTFETVGGPRYEGKLVIVASRMDSALRRAEKFLRNRIDELTGRVESEKLSKTADVVWYDSGDY